MPTGSTEEQPDAGIDFVALAERLRPLEAVYAGMTDAEVARAVWRKQMIAAGACADFAVGGTGARTIVSALDKVGAFLEKAAAGFALLHGVLKDSAAEDSARCATERRPHDNDPLARAIDTWTRRANA